MSVFSLKRGVFPALFLLLAAAPSLFAAGPSARTETRMAYNARTSHTILFGGTTTADIATGLTTDLADTWEFTGFHWVQRYPFHSPTGRGAHAMVYDSKRDRIVLFGGRNGKTQLNDTWAYHDDDWTRLETADSPSVRLLPGAAYDAKRDRIVLFGGSQVSEDGKTTTYLQDTWEFDGTNWIKRNDGPAVRKPILVYDAARDQVLMLGINDKTETQMYAYDAVSSTWNQLHPATMPECVNEGAVTFDTRRNVVQVVGGICSGSTNTELLYEWDGTNWTKVTITLAMGNIYGEALAYDSSRGYTVVFGGTNLAGSARAATYLYSGGIFLIVGDATAPVQRSLPIFVTFPDPNPDPVTGPDPKKGRIILFAGLNETGELVDLWQYQNGVWSIIDDAKIPIGCSQPTGTYDSDRKKLVLYCGFDSSVHEWDGTTWKDFVSFKDNQKPAPRRLQAMVYDANIKKSVIFGGYDNNYRDDTWTWDGTTWNRVKKNPAPSRTNTAMWYDPLMNRTVLYGGIGRLTSEDRLVRFSDMWSFDGDGWTEMKPSSTPGVRYGAQVTVNPATKHALLFGGLRLDVNGTVQTQVYANDLWEWDGSKQSWTQLSPVKSPPGRENAGFTYDPSRDNFVLFGGYAGQYLSDVWTLEKNLSTWTVQTSPVRRRRASGVTAAPTTGSSIMTLQPTAN